jgi:hypothetical protein
MKISRIAQNKLAENEYTAKVHIRAKEYAPNHEWIAEIDDSILFRYNIDLAIHSWGIRDISVVCKDIAQTHMLISHYNEDGDVVNTEDKPISIDMAKLKINYVSGNGIYVSNVHIELNKDLTIDYNNSEIDVVKGI